MNRNWWIRTAAVAVYVPAVTYMAGQWAFRTAYMDRGYVAVGGEYLVIPWAAWVAYKVISIFFDVLEEEGGAEQEKEGQKMEKEHSAKNQSALRDK